MTTATIVRRRTPLWAKLLLVLLVLLLVAGAAYGGIIIGKFLGAGEQRSVTVIRSIEREEQVVLVTAGVNELEPVTTEGFSFSIPGLDLIPGVQPFQLSLPGSQRAMLVRYDYDAKLGIEGEDVVIEQVGDNSYRIKIPEFIYIGSNEAVFQVASEENGILSWTTPEIDKFELVAKALSEEAVAETIEGMLPVLQEQARVFYTSIITAIDPEITLQFEFAQ